MRVIAGAARGIPLTAPRGAAIRPTLDRVRESLFNMLGPRLEDAAFLDLYAGTGANGIEALSRGARRAGFVDNDPRSLDLIRRNLAATGLGDAATLWRLTLPAGLTNLVSQASPHDIVFADPPREFSDFTGLFEAILEGKQLKPDGVLVVEHASGAPLESKGLLRTRTETYGRSGLSFFTATGPA